MQYFLIFALPHEGESATSKLRKRAIFLNFPGPQGVSQPPQKLRKHTIFLNFPLLEGVGKPRESKKPQNAIFHFLKFLCYLCVNHSHTHRRFYITSCQTPEYYRVALNFIICKVLGDTTTGARPPSKSDKTATRT